MTLTPEIIKRLSFIKYFYEFAREQSKLPHPQNFISVLMFHDSVELFLHLSAEFLGANISNDSFMGYFEPINRKLGDNNITQKTAMKTLNKERVNLKHYNIYPNSENLERHRVNVRNFFEENCLLVFGIEFSEISLLDIVQDDEVKKLLKDAQDYINKIQYLGALERIGVAFYVLLENYKESKNVGFRRYLFDIGKDLSFTGRFGEFGDELRDVAETVRSIQTILKLIMFNIDYRKYIKFRIYTPDNIRKIFKPKADLFEEKYSIFWDSAKKNFDFEKKHVMYCFNFVIESANNLQQFNFEVEKDFGDMFLSDAW